MSIRWFGILNHVGLIKRLVWLMVVGCLSVPVLAQAVKVTQTLATTNATVGDKVGYTFTVTYPRSGVLLPVPSIGLPDDVVTTEFKKERVVQSGQITDRFTAKLVPFAVGRFWVPTRAISVRVNGGVQTVQLPSLLLSVRSVLTPKDHQLADLKRVETPDLPLVFAVGGVILLSILGLVGWRFRRRAVQDFGPPVPVPAVDPYQQIVSTVSDSAGDFAALSYGLRWFLSYRFGCPALGLTTFEIVRALEHQLPQSQLTTLADVLGLCDQVKFARHVPTANAARLAREAALAFVMAYPDPSQGEGQ